MIIQCSNCKAKFKIPDAKAKKDEFKARCAKCEQIFLAKVGVNVFPETALAEEPKEIQKEVKKETPKQDVFASALFDSKELSIEETKAPPVEKSKAEKSIGELLAEEFPEGDTSEMKKNMDLGELKTQMHASDAPKVAKAESPLKSHKITPKRPDSINWKVGILLYFLVVVVSLFGGLIYAGLNFPFRDYKLVFSKNPDAMGKGPTFTQVGSEFVDTVTGKLFVISGKVFNNSPRPLADMNITAELYSERNLFLKKERFPCCASFDRRVLHEIRDLNSLGIMYRKDAKAEIKPYEELPFMLVLNKPDDPIRSFRLDIANE